MTRLDVALRGDLRRVMAAEARRGERAVTNAVRRQAEALKEELRDQVDAAGMGERLARTWQSRVYPERGVSMGAAAMVWTKAPTIIRAHSEGVRIKSEDGFFLAIPTENAPKRGVGRKPITPMTFPKHRFGPLRFVYRRGAPSLLVVDGVRITPAGNVSRQLKHTRKKSGAHRKGVTSVIMFVLLPEVTLRASLDPEAAIRRSERALPFTLAQAWEDEDRRAAARRRAQ